MLKEFPNISLLLEQIYVFKARIAELAVVTLLYFEISPVEKIHNIFFWAPKSQQMVIAAMKLKDAYSLKGK